jgi:hypothetical protein
MNSVDLGIVALQLIFGGMYVYRCNQIRQLENSLVKHERLVKSLDNVIAAQNKYINLLVASKRPTHGCHS